MGNAAYAKRCLILGVIATCLLMFVSIYWDDFGKGYWKYFIALTYTNLIWEFAKRNQGNEIRELLASGATRNSYWKLLCISIATLLSMLAFGCCIGVIQVLFE